MIIRKTISWRVLMLIFSRVYFGEWTEAVIWNVVTTVIYYGHEVLWNKVRSK